MWARERQAAFIIILLRNVFWSDVQQRTQHNNTSTHEKPKQGTHFNV